MAPATTRATCSRLKHTFDQSITELSITCTPENKTELTNHADATKIYRWRPFKMAKLALIKAEASPFRMGTKDILNAALAPIFIFSLIFSSERQPKSIPKHVILMC